MGAPHGDHGTGLARLLQGLSENGSANPNWLRVVLRGAGRDRRLARDVVGRGAVAERRLSGV